MVNSEKTLLCKLVNCQAEAFNFVKQSCDPAMPPLIINLYQGQNLQMVCDDESVGSKWDLFNWQHPYILQFYQGIDLDQFAPQYEFSVLRNLYSLRDKIDHDLQELEPVMDDYMLLLVTENLDNVQRRAKEKAEKQILDFWLLYRKVVSVVGGFLMLEHFDDCLPIMIKKYHYCRKRFALTGKLSHINDSLLKCYDEQHELIASKQGKVKLLEVKADLIQTQIKQFDRQILEIDRKLQDLRDFYADDASFSMHEKYRETALCLNYLTRSERKILASEIVLITVDDLVHAESNGIDFASVLTELAEGTMQIKQQVEIQSFYDLLAQFVASANCRAQSCLYSPLLLTVEQRKNYGLKLLKHRPKFLLWNSVSNIMQAKGLKSEWLTFLDLLAEHEQISNCLINETDLNLTKDFALAKCTVVDNLVVHVVNLGKELNSDSKSIIEAESGVNRTIELEQEASVHAEETSDAKCELTKNEPIVAENEGETSSSLLVNEVTNEKLNKVDGKRNELISEVTELLADATDKEME